MATTVQNIIDKVKSRTHHTSDGVVLNEIQEAADWLFNRLFNSENGPDLLSTYGTEVTLSTYTREYDIAANVTGIFFSIKVLWAKLPGDTIFTPMVPADSTDRRFIPGDNTLAADQSKTAQGHPIYYDPTNFGKVRFSPALPANTILRIDFYRKPSVLDPTTNNSFNYSLDLPEATAEVLKDKATGLVFGVLDDERELIWDRRAEIGLNDLLYGLNRRFQGPTTTTPFKTRRPRVI